jgi:hypothetical protein
MSLGYVPYGGDPTKNSREYGEWEKSQQERGNFSKLFILLKTGSADSFVHTVLFGKNENDENSETTVPNQRLTVLEEKIVKKAIQSCECDIKPVDISKMFARTLLNYLGNPFSSNNRKNKSQLLTKFLEYWGKLLLVSKHQEMLENIALFMKGDFERIDDVDSVVLLKQKQLIAKLEELYKTDRI